MAQLLQILLLCRGRLWGRLRGLCSWCCGCWGCRATGLLGLLALQGDEAYGWSTVTEPLKHTAARPRNYFPKSTWLVHPSYPWHGGCRNRPVLGVSTNQRLGSGGKPQGPSPPALRALLQNAIGQGLLHLSPDVLSQGFHLKAVGTLGPLDEQSQ